MTGNNVPSDDEVGQEGTGPSDQQLQMPQVSRRDLFKLAALAAAKRFVGSNESEEVAAVPVDAGRSETHTRIESATAEPDVNQALADFKTKTGFDLPVREIDGEKVVDFDAFLLNNKDELQRIADNPEKLKIMRAGLTEVLWSILIPLGIALYIAGKVRKPNNERRGSNEAAVRAQVQRIHDTLDQERLIGTQPYQINDADINRQLTVERMFGTAAPGAAAPAAPRRGATPAIWERFNDDNNLHDIIVDEARRVRAFIASGPDLSIQDNRNRAKNTIMGDLVQHDLALSPGEAPTAANAFKVNPDALDPTATPANFTTQMTIVITHLNTMATNVANPNSQAFITAERARINALRPRIERQINDLVRFRRELGKDMTLPELGGDMINGGTIARREALAKLLGAAAVGTGVVALGWKLIGGDFFSSEKPPEPKKPAPLKDATKGGGGGDGEETPPAETDPRAPKDENEIYDDGSDKPDAGKKGGTKKPPKSAPPTQETDPETRKRMERLKRIESGKEG